MANYANNNFNFDQFNNMTDKIPAGLQTHLALQLLHNALFSLDRFDNPRADDLRGIVGELKILRANMKQDAANREASQAQLGRGHTKKD